MAEILGTPYANLGLGQAKQRLESEKFKVERAAEEEKQRKLAEDFEKRKRKELIASEMGLSPQEKSQFLGANVPGVEPGPTPEGTGQAAKAATPAQVPVGGEGTKPSETKPTSDLEKSQGKLQAAVDKAAKGKGDPNKPLPKSKTDEIIGQMDNVVKDVNALPEFQQSPIRSDLLQLRAEAYRLYKEKADRNEWMDVAERALNAIGQLASARAATGQQVGGLPLSRTDYGARTEQAFREYQAELGLAGEKVRGEEREAERFETKKEKEIGRRLGTLGEKLKSERMAEEEAAALQRAKIAAGGRESAATARAEAAAEKNYLRSLSEKEDKAKETSSRLQKEINIINKLVSGKAKDINTAVNMFAVETGQSPEQLKEEIKGIEIPGNWFTSTGEAKQKILADYQAGKAAEVKRLRADAQKYFDERVGILEGTRKPAESQPVATPTPPAGQPPTESDMVIAQIPGNQPMKLTREAATRAKQKYPNLIITPVR